MLQYFVRDSFMYKNSTNTRTNKRFWFERPLFLLTGTEERLFMGNVKTITKRMRKMVVLACHCWTVHLMSKGSAMK